MSNKWFGVIYVLTNITNGMQYVGKSVDHEQRWKTHIALARGKSQHYIHRAIRKYKVKNFSIEVVQHCRTLETLNKAEIHWIKKLNTLTSHGYNMTKGGDGVMAGFKDSKCTRRKKSAAMLIHWAIPSERKAHVASLNSVAAVSNMSAAQKRRFAKMTKKERAAFSAKMTSALKKRYKDPEAHAVMRKGQRRRFKDPIKRAANAKAHRTKKFRAVQAADSKARWQDKNYRKRLLATKRSDKSRRKQARASKNWHADETKNAKWLASVQAPKTGKKISKSLLAWHAEPKNKKKHLKAHRKKAFRTKKAKDTRAFWLAMKPAERKTYWHKIHPHGNK